MAEGIKAADIVYDIYATVEKVKSENKESSRAMDAWVNELKTENNKGVIACGAVFWAGGQKRK